MRAIAALSLLIAVSTASAQTPPPSLPPPMYSPLNTHAQGSGQAAGFEVHRLRDYQISVFVPANADDLRAVIPDGYIVPDNAFVTIIFVFQERTRVTEEGHDARPCLSPTTHGPFNQLVILTGATRTATNESQLLILEALRPSEAAADLDNEIFGAGSTWVADKLKVEIETEAPDGLMTVKGHAEMDDLCVGIEAKNVPATTWASARNGLGGPFQQLDTSAGSAQRPTPLQKIRTAAGSDAIGVPAVYWKVTLPKNELGESELRLRVGTVRTGLPVGGVIARWHELLQKFKD